MISTTSNVVSVTRECGHIMKLLEHQAKVLLLKYGLPINQSTVIGSRDELSIALEAAEFPLVLKAQVPFGGRGKAGAVRFAETINDARRHARKLLELNLRGISVSLISLEPKVFYTKELYVGVTWDTALKLPMVMLSLIGGVDIEEAAEDQVARRSFNPMEGLSTYAGREMADELGITGKAITELGTILQRLTVAFIDLDALTLEINPLVEIDNGMYMGLDARLEIEDDAMFRQRDQIGGLIVQETSPTGKAPTAMELEAQRIDSADHRGVAGRVVEFDGDLALLIGGGGASLTIFDAIRRYGGSPANYCEVGGNPTEEKVAALTEILLSKPGVTQMAVIMNVVNNTRADVMARGVLEGIRRLGREPSELITVFRIPGSWEDEAREIMSECGVPTLGREVSLDEAARLAVERSRSNVA